MTYKVGDILVLVSPPNSDFCGRIFRVETDKVSLTTLMWTSCEWVNEYLIPYTRQASEIEAILVALLGTPLDGSAQAPIASND